MLAQLYPRRLQTCHTQKFWSLQDTQQWLVCGLSRMNITQLTSVTESQLKTYFLLSNVLTVLFSLQWTKNKWTSIFIFMQTRLLPNWMNLCSHIYKFTYDNPQRFFPFSDINSGEFFNKCKNTFEFKMVVSSNNA